MNDSAKLLPLKDIHLPEAPGFWPLAPGWWILIVVVIISITAAFYISKVLIKKHRQKRALNQRILSEFKNIQLAYNDSKNQHQLACDISAFLRRLILHELKAGDAVSLADDEWIVGLEYLTGVDLSAHKKALVEAPYNPNIQFDVMGLIKDIEKLCLAIVNQQGKRPDKSAKQQQNQPIIQATSQTNVAASTEGSNV